MRHWFLSFNSADRALAERLKAAIEHKDVGSRVVFHAGTSLRAGGFWQPALAKAIDEADVFVLLVGERGLGPWQTLEYYEAHDKHVKSPEFPVVMMLLDGHAAPGLPFLRQLHWIVSADPASEKDVVRLVESAVGTGARPGELWRYTSPYRGLSAMEEKDADYFFGRGRETAEVVKALASKPNKLPVLLGNSGVGKSSVAQAGVLAALKSQTWPMNAEIAAEWPHAFRESRHWCFLTLNPGTEPLKALVEAFLDTWQLGSTDPERLKQKNGWFELLGDGKAMLSDLLDASERRYRELGRSEPPAFLTYVDQGEELYTRANERQSRRFSEVITQGVADPRLYTLMSMRSDCFGELQKDEPLYKAHLQINVPPLREAGMREVVSRPAELLGARFETAELVEIITRRTAEDSVKDVGALPLLSYTLEDMWMQMVMRGDGVLRLPAQQFELGAILVYRADAFLAAHPDSQRELRRIFTLKLATVREDEEPRRRRAMRSEFTDAEWRLVSELADHPTRLVATVTSESGETFAEVQHEAIFRRWEKLREWIAAEREFLAWRTSLEVAHRTWRATPVPLKTQALLMGLPLQQAQSWLANRAEDIPDPDRAFITESINLWGATTLPRGGPALKSTSRPSPEPRGRKVFISYRRSDTAQIVGRVYDRLKSEISEDDLVFDVNTIPIGVDFKEYISGAVGESAVLLVMVGEKWLSSAWKRTRWWFESKPKVDFVQVEIELALDLGVPILPLLVDSTAMPNVDDLPNSIKEFVFLNAAAIRSGRDFHKDMDRVLERIVPLRKRGIGLKGS
jgi:hypothetical protein